MEYHSPSAAFSNSIESFMIGREAKRRQDMMDQLAVQREARQNRNDEEDRLIRRDEMQARKDEREQRHLDEQKDTLGKKASNMLPGDVAPPEWVAEDQKLGTGYFRMPAPAGTPVPGAADMQTGQPVVAPSPPEGIAEPMQPVYPGNRQDRQAADAHTAKKAWIASLPPDSMERQAAEYEDRTGHPIPANITKPDVPVNEPIMQQNPRTGKVERLVNGAWEPVLGDVPKGSHFMTTPPPKDTGAKDARDATHRDLVYHQAITDLDKMATPATSHLQTINDLGIMLNARTPEADALIAPMVLKATVSGAGTGFRMTQSEINQVVGGRSKWESLSAALQKWSLNPKDALSITDEQRTEIRDLAKGIRKKAITNLDKISKARHSLDDYDNPRDIQKTVTSLKDQVNADDQPEPTKLSAEDLIKKYGGG